MSGANLTLPQDGHTVGMDQRSFLLANVPFPLLIVVPRVESESNHVSIPHALAGVLYKR